MSKRKNILPQMYDVKPVKPDGTLDLERIGKIRRVAILPTNSGHEDAIRNHSSGTGAKHLRLTDVTKPKNTPRPANKISFDAPNTFSQNEIGPVEPTRVHFVTENTDNFFDFPEEKIRKTEKDKLFFPFTDSRKKRKRSFRSFFSSKRNKFHVFLDDRKESVSGPFSKLQFGYSFAAILIIFSLSIPALSIVQRALNMKTDMISTGHEVLGQFAKAKDSLSSSQFDKAAVDFSDSYNILNDANRNLSGIGGNFSEILRFIPGASRIATAKYVISAGEHFSLAGKNISESAKSLSSISNPLEDSNNANQPSLTDLFLNLRDVIEKSSIELTQAQNDLDKVNVDDLPSETRGQFAELKNKLPVINSSLKNFLDYSRIFLDVLGYNGPRKYLFLFQNNQEMRATGGFIGSYGILDISDGRVKKLFVDDIYNPDGQLKARVIPPAPIQKMSAVWTMHDANWFPDFPTSAEKVSWFYEKTGGPTVDGVIAITPELLQDLLKVTGPIDMPEYEKTIDSDNFIEQTQQEVEVDYDKEQNQPKKIIADLTPKILDKVFSERGLVPMAKTLQAFNTALEEKHLLLYSRNFNIQKLISDEKWSGEIMQTDKDYLSVINTNINGFKTDGVIDETIDHSSDFQADGSIIDTVTVTRLHKGGNEKFDWWNKVNGDWMRVYVPKGSKFLSVDGQTREIVPPALDYDSLGFKKDPQVQSLNDSTRTDDDSGTQIYEENGKTVFANWVYVSPGESVTITYKYLLPFRISFDDLHHPVDSYSVLYQKQSGSIGSKLISQIKLPDSIKPVWHWPDDLKQDGNSYRMENVLDTDKFLGMAVEKQ